MNHLRYPNVEWRPIFQLATHITDDICCIETNVFLSLLSIWYLVHFFDLDNITGTSVNRNSNLTFRFWLVCINIDPSVLTYKAWSYAGW